MDILVFVKQVPDDSVEIHLDSAGTPATKDVEKVTNAFDTYALELFATLSSDEFKKTAAAKKNLCGCRSNWRLEAKKSPVVPGK